MNTGLLQSVVTVGLGPCQPTLVEVAERWPRICSFDVLLDNPIGSRVVRLPSEIEVSDNRIDNVPHRQAVQHSEIIHECDEVLAALDLFSWIPLLPWHACLP